VLYLLEPVPMRRIAGLLSGDPLIAFDFDGTLAPLVTDRTTAAMRPRTRELLAEVADRFTVAVISGRSRADLMPRLAGLRIRWVAGNHGMEREDATPDYEAPVARWAAALAPQLSRIPGAELENKRLSLSLHYRGAPNPALAAQQIRQAAMQLGQQAHVTEGKLVINIVPVGAPNKFDALRDIMNRMELGTGLFAGDDTTDEDVFARADPSSILTVKVGRSNDSRAAYYLRSQEDMDVLLELIRDSREAADGNDLDSAPGVSDAR
jgi:trehalose 6-phosphate phosphatase